MLRLLEILEYIRQILSSVILKFPLLCLHQLKNQPSICCVYIVLYVHWRGGGGIDLAKATKQPCEATSSSIYCCTKAIVRYWFATAACYRAARRRSMPRRRLIDAALHAALLVYTIMPSAALRRCWRGRRQCSTLLLRLSFAIEECAIWLILLLILVILLYSSSS